MRNDGNSQYVDVFNEYLKELAPRGLAEFREGIEEKLKEFSDPKYKINFHWNNGNIQFKDYRKRSDESGKFLEILSSGESFINLNQKN